MKEKAIAELNEVVERLPLSDISQVIAFAKSFLNKQNKDMYSQEEKRPSEMKNIYNKILEELNKNIVELNKNLEMFNREVFTAKQAAEYLKIGYDTILRLTRIGEIEYVPNGASYLYRKEYLDRWMDKNKKDRVF